MAFPINNLDNFINKFETNKIFNLYLNKNKRNKRIDQVDIYTITELFYINNSTTFPKRSDSQNIKTFNNNKIEKRHLSKLFIDFCNDIKKSSSINKEINKYNLKRQNNMDIHNINYNNINSTFRNICPSLNKLLEIEKYNKKVIKLFNKDNTHGAWSIGTTDKVYKYRYLFNNKFNF